MHMYFAHNGVDHASELESAAHSGTSTIVTLSLITLGVVAFIVVVSFLVRRFTKAEEIVEEEEL